MAWWAPVDSDNAQRAAELTMQLHDPAVSALPDDVGARHAGAILVIAALRHRFDDQELPLLAPASCAVRLVRVTATDAPAQLAGNLRHMYQLDPLPFTNGPSLRRMKRGLPTFYMGWEDMDTTDQRQRRLAPGDELGRAGPGATAYVGVLFQDGVSVWPWEWIEEIAIAMDDAGETDEATEWRLLDNIYATEVPSSYRVLDHVGRPLAGAAFEVREAASAVTATVTVGADSDLEQIVATDTTLGTLFPAPSDPDRELRFVSGPSDITLIADTRDTDGAPPGAWMTVPRRTDNRRGSVHVLDLDRWLAVPPATASVDRLRAASKFEPIVDGHDYFRKLHADLLLAAVPPAPPVPPDPDGLAHYGAHFAGFTFQDFEMLLGDADSTLTQVLDDLLAGGATTRMLVSKLLQLEDGAIVTRSLSFWIALGIGAIYAAEETSDPTTLGIVFAGVAATAALATWLYLTLSTDPEAGLDSFEQGDDFVDAINDLPNAADILAVLSRHPAPLSANPHADLPDFLSDISNHVGAYHQKFVVVRNRLVNPVGDGWIGYVGGMDVHTTRMSAPGHQTDDRRWHDVQARITGPAVRDLFVSFAERWEVDRTAHGQQGAERTIPTPDLAALDPQPEGHVVQIARTYFEPAPAEDGLPFAGGGENMIYDTMRHAIEQARRYIYIEDQYFTPNDDPDGEPGSSYFSALLDAAEQCDRLLVVSPHRTDQPFGEQRRSQLVGRLIEQWGRRVQVVHPFRRPLLPKAGAVASRYRARLFNDVATDQSTGLLIGPKNRLPADPGFWLWIGGELMMSTRVSDGGQVDGVQCALVDVARHGLGDDAGWGASRRPHLAGNPVTLAGMPGIFVHTKMIIVDDVFVGVGTANLNRRGFFHDGEIHAFCVPQGLLGAASNPAKQLRCALWAEHLGLPPNMGRALLADPIVGFELFRRSRYLGNRSAALTDFDVEALLPLEPYEGGFLKWLIITGQVAMSSLVEGFSEQIWNTIVDPTTSADSASPDNPF